MPVTERGNESKETEQEIKMERSSISSKFQVGSSASSGFRRGRELQEAPTLLRIKRKKRAADEQQTQEGDSEDKVLKNLFITKKKLKFSQEETRVFTFFKTVCHSSPKTRQEAMGGSTQEMKSYQAMPSAAPAREETNGSSSLQPLLHHRSPVKKAFHQPSMDQVKQVLSSKMIQKAKDTRYRLRDEKRKRQLVQDGIMYNVVDIERDDGIDPLTRSLEAMTQEFLKSKLDDAAATRGEEDDERRSGDSSDSDDALYDLYIYNHNAPLADVLNSGLVGTLYVF